jgi:hypothetical protein
MIMEAKRPRLHEGRFKAPKIFGPYFRLHFARISSPAPARFCDLGKSTSNQNPIFWARSRQTMKTETLIGVLFATLLIFSGCATCHKQLDNDLSRLSGQHLQSAVAVLGDPQSAVDLKDKKVYYWHNQTEALLMRSTESGETVLDTARYDCRIKLTTDPQDVIQSATHEGNQAACKKWADSFRVQR